MEGPNPVTSLSAEDLKDTGATDLIGALAKLPIAGAVPFRLKQTQAMTQQMVVQVYRCVV